jgi:hypothetical protein
VAGVVCNALGRHHSESWYYTSCLRGEWIGATSWELGRRDVRRSNYRVVDGRCLNSTKKSGSESVSCRKARRMSKTRPVWGARMYCGIIHPCTAQGRPLLAGSAAHLQSSAPAACVACPFQGSTANDANPRDCSRPTSGRVYRSKCQSHAQFALLRSSTPITICECYVVA